MKNFFIEILSSGPKAAGAIFFTALLFVIFFYNDNKATFADISPKKELTPQEEIIIQEQKIENLKFELNNCIKERDYYEN